jgi:hypothetical protein
MSLYIVTHLHEYGATSYLVSSEQHPTAKQVVRELELDFEPSKLETLEITQLSDEEYRSPRRLNRLDGDDEEFEEFPSHA